jgi:hypothetical protein
MLAVAEVGITELDLLLLLVVQGAVALGQVEITLLLLTPHLALLIRAVEAVELVAAARLMQVQAATAAVAS